MAKDTLPRFEDDRLREDYELAIRLAENQRLLEAWSEIASDPDLFPTVREDPVGFLRERGVRIPERLGINLLDSLRPAAQPDPETECFTFRLFNCRSVWVSDEDGEPPRQVELERPAIGWSEALISRQHSEN